MSPTPHRDPKTPPRTTRQRDGHETRTLVLTIAGYSGGHHDELVVYTSETFTRPPVAPGADRAR